MIAVDTSAIVAVLLREPDRRRFLSYMVTTPRLCVSAPTLVELRIVAYSKLGSSHEGEVRALLEGVWIGVLDFTEAQSSIAADAWRRYGRGSGRAAKLNFGDCFSDALARSLDAPLLFMGDDFLAPDVTAALSL